MTDTDNPMFIPRPKQQEVLNYTGGRMGVSAVPGSGKTLTLSVLAAQLVVGDMLADDQEVLVVTLVNSAVDNFAGQMARFIQKRGLLPHLGYRVRTLHGLAHDIVRERPALVGLSEDFQIVDERTSGEILQDSAEAWVRSHPYAADDLFSDDLDEGRREWVRRSKWPGLVIEVARSFIRGAKDRQLTPVQLQARLSRPADFLSPLPMGEGSGEGELSLLEMCLSIYADYQRALIYRGAVDFDDLIRLALWALQLDQEYLERLQYRWPFILEDEAQDSSRLQEKILRLLVGREGNWVRVGDPNQAIYETFTTANPSYLRSFLKEDGVAERELPNSGRSTQSIINLANHLIDWTRSQHPVIEVRDALALPHIEPVPPGDQQSNPTDDPTQVFIFPRGFTPAEELKAVVDSLARWLPAHQDEDGKGKRTVAVLVPRNRRGDQVVDELKKRGLPYVELLRSTISTREAAGAVSNVLNYLADPVSPVKLAKIYQVWRRDDRKDDDARPVYEAGAKVLRKCQHVEDLISPRVGRDWLDELDVGDEFPDLFQQFEQFRTLVRRWQAAILLPIDQLVLTLAQDLFVEPADLAVAHKLAVLLRRASESHPDWRLPELTQELATIARNERRFLGIGGDDSRFDPDQHKGRVVVTTIHKAKGLEWDRVYLMAVNNYNFPSAQSHDQFIAEKWFVRDRLNLEAEVLAQLADLAEEGEGVGVWEEKGVGVWEEEGADVWEGEGVSVDEWGDDGPTQRARWEYAGERLRLLYVGITRAKEDLVITWNTGRRGDQQPATPFIALQTFWERQGEEQSHDLTV